jgi:uncharacterized membrane protein
MLCIHDTTKTNNNQQFVAFSWRFFSTFLGNFCVIAGRTPHIHTVVFKNAAAAAAAQNAVENRRAVCYDEGKSEKGATDHV